MNAKGSFEKTAWFKSITRLLTFFILLTLLTSANFGRTAADGEVPPGDIPQDLSGLNSKRGSKPGLPSISSNLYRFLQAWEEDPLAAQSLAQQRGFDLSQGRVKVTITMLKEEQVKVLLNALANYGGEVDAQYKRWVDAWVPIRQLRSLAGVEGISFIDKPIPIFTIEDMNQSTSAPINAGSYLTQGVAASNADDWHSAGYTGAGVDVAVLDSFQSYTGAQSVGELPTSIASYGTLDLSSPHGTAVAEIIYDMAPGASLTFASPGSPTQMAQYIENLAVGGHEVISSSMLFYNAEPGDGTGAVSSAINTAYNDYGTLYVQAAGNQANYHWDGDFIDSNENTYHEFAPGNELNIMNVYGTGYLYIFLRWNDWPVSDQDYDLELFKWDPGGGVWNLVDFSWNSQTGTQPPTEAIQYFVSESEPVLYGLAIPLWEADGTAVMDMMGHNAPSFGYNVQDRSLVDPATATYSFSVAAVDKSTFNRESYSSVGPTHGPGGALTGGIDKPRISGYANVDTWSYGYGVFNGTSAAAPHVAGAAALVFGVRPWYNAGDVMSFLEGQAIDGGPVGYDLQYGAGRLYLGVPLPYYQILLPIIAKQ